MSFVSLFFDVFVEVDGGGDYDCVYVVCWVVVVVGVEGGGLGEEGCCCGEGEEENFFGVGIERLLDGWGVWGWGGGKGVYNWIGLGCCGGFILVVGFRGCFRVGLVEVEVDGWEICMWWVGVRLRLEGWEYLGVFLFVGGERCNEVKRILGLILVGLWFVLEVKWLVGLS